MTEGTWGATGGGGRPTEGVQQEEKGAREPGEQYKESVALQELLWVREKSPWMQQNGLVDRRNLRVQHKEVEVQRKERRDVTECALDEREKEILRTL